MFQKISFIVTLWLVAIQISFSQEENISGKVIDDESQEPVVGALVIVDEEYSAFSNESGDFVVSLPASNSHHHTVKISFVGYQPQEVQWMKESGFLTIALTKKAEIDAVVVEGEQMATDIDPLAGQQIELVSGKELLKAACCNLSESFENSATVDVSYSDAVTGSKQISMLGLAGVYTQMNWENMPLVRGIGEYYGLSFVPGTWIESIQVGKGAGSVVNGFESMAGQINVEFFKPDNMDKLYLNGYQNAQGRTELNAHAGKVFNEKWSTGLFVHGNMINGEVDGNDDGFNDRNQGRQINLMNRWKYESAGNMRSQFGFKYLQDNKVGGQLGFEDGDTFQSTGLYGVDVNSKRVELFGKLGVIFPEKPWKSIGLIVNGLNHRQDALYGIQAIDSEQNSIYGNFIYQTMIHDTRHKLKTGANFQFDDFNEALDEVATEREYSVPGVFAEYDYDNLKNIKLVLGLRTDYLDSNDKLEVSPRAHFKWTTDGENAIRLSAGRGFRVPNLYADAPAMLVSSREVVIEELPLIESSWNMGASITRYLFLNGKEGTFVADFYRTSFQNQLIRDFYSSPNHVFIQNLEGSSYSNSFQTSLDYELFDRFDVRLAYKRDDVKQDIEGKRVERQLVPKNRALVNLGYATNYDRWKFDATAQYTGEQRLPTTSATPSGLENAYFSDAFWRFNGQVTTKYRDWEFYLGGENLSNFRQENPIIDAENPFGNEFDTSSVWGPIQGANMYLGFRYRVKK